jgi:hypothetical protein
MIKAPLECKKQAQNVLFKPRTLPGLFARQIVKIRVPFLSSSVQRCDWPKMKYDHHLLRVGGNRVEVCFQVSVPKSAAETSIFGQKSAMSTASVANHRCGKPRGPIWEPETVSSASASVLRVNFIVFVRLSTLGHLPERRFGQGLVGSGPPWTQAR